MRQLLYKKVVPHYYLAHRINSGRRERTKKFNSLVGQVVEGKATNSTLEKHCKKVGLRINRLDPSILTALIKDVKTGIPSMELTMILDSVSAAIFTAGEWLELSMYFMGLGFFQGARICRLKSYSTDNGVIPKLIYRLVKPHHYISSFFDQGRWAEIPELLAKEESVEGAMGPLVRKLIKGEKGVGLQINKEYYSLVSGKSVAVIGPLQFEEDYRDEIAGFDLVIELNALMSKREQARKRYHGKPHISYYNNGRIRRRGQETLDNLIEGCEFLVFKERKLTEGHPIIDKALELGSAYRHMISPDISPWNGTFAMMERTISDLILFDPAQIKIFGVDLYTSFNYSAAYGNRAPRNLNRKVIEFTYHDIYTQFLYMKNLFERDFFFGDDRLQRVLSLNFEQYAAELEKAYGIYLYAENDVR